MYTQFYHIRLIVTVVGLAVDLYSVGLWSVAFMRTGRRFFVLLAMASADALFLSLVGTAFAYDLAGMKRFDPGNILYGFSCFVAQPVVALLTVVGQTLLVRWLLQTHGHKSRGV